MSSHPRREVASARDDIISAHVFFPFPFLSLETFRGDIRSLNLTFCIVNSHSSTIT